MGGFQGRLVSRVNVRWPWAVRQDCMTHPQTGSPLRAYECAGTHTFIWKPRDVLSPKSEVCAYFWQLWSLYCRVTSQARNLHQRAKKNTSKNKHESQDFMPGTPATHILLAGFLDSPHSCDSFKPSGSSDDLDLVSAPGSHSSVLELFHGVAKWFKSRKEGSEVIRR